MSCFVRNCKNIKRLMPINSEVTFHRFPKNEKRFRLWLDAIGIKWHESFTWSKTMFICSLHFNKNDILKTYSRLTLIKKEAIPFIEKNFEYKNEPLPLSLNIVDPLLLTPSSLMVSPFERKMLKKNDGSENVFIPLERSAKSQSPSELSGTGCLLSGSDSDTDRLRKLLKVEHSYSVTPETAKRKSHKLKGKRIKYLCDK